MSILDNVLKNQSTAEPDDEYNTKDWKMYDLIYWKGQYVDLYAVLVKPKGGFWMAKVVWSNGAYGYTEGEEIALNESFSENHNLDNMLNSEWWIQDDADDQVVYAIDLDDRVKYKDHVGKKWQSAMFTSKYLKDHYRYKRQIFLPEWYLK